jgi:hypothetical protein
LLCLMPTASAINITATMGESWIIYQWEPNYTVNVYIDGVKQDTAATFHDYYLTNLNPNEKHQLRLYNASNATQILGTVTVTTLNSQTFIQVLIVLLIVFLIIELILKDPIKIILVGGLSASISLYTSSIAVGYGALAIIPLATLVITVIFVVYALWNLIIEKTRW